MLKIRFFTLGQYPQEQAWLEEEARKGNILQKTILPCFFLFEKEKPQNLIYRYDFIPSDKTEAECIALYSEYGWKYVTKMNGFVLFVHEADTASRQDLELFSSAESKNEMIQRILKNRMYPLLGLLVVMIALSIFCIARNPSLDTLFIQIGCTLIVGWVDLSCLWQLRKLQKQNTALRR